MSRGEGLTILLNMIWFLVWHSRRPVGRLGTLRIFDGIIFGEAAVVRMCALLLGLDFLNPQLGNESAGHLLNSLESLDNPFLGLSCVSHLERYHLAHAILHSLRTNVFGATLCVAWYAAEVGVHSWTFVWTLEQRRDGANIGVNGHERDILLLRCFRLSEANGRLSFEIVSGTEEKDAGQATHRACQPPNWKFSLRLGIAVRWRC